jgi:hypothetical protein
LVCDGQSSAVKCLVEGRFGGLLGHRSASLETDTGEEDLLVEANASTADEDHSGYRGDERLFKVVDHDSRDATQ